MVPASVRAVGFAVECDFGQVGHCDAAHSVASGAKRAVRHDLAVCLGGGRVVVGELLDVGECAQLVDEQVRAWLRQGKGAAKERLGGWESIGQHEDVLNRAGSGGGPSHRRCADPFRGVGVRLPLP
jgi:hypothetical protein